MPLRTDFKIVLCKDGALRSLTQGLTTSLCILLGIMGEASRLPSAPDMSAFIFFPTYVPPFRSFLYGHRRVVGERIRTYLSALGGYSPKAYQGAANNDRLLICQGIGLDRDALLLGGIMFHVEH